MADPTMCGTLQGCGGYDHGDCRDCDAPLECDEARSGICDSCWQNRDEFGDQ
jgi:hypothetical protein